MKSSFERALNLKHLVIFIMMSMAYSAAASNPSKLENDRIHAGSENRIEVGDIKAVTFNCQAKVVQSFCLEEYGEECRIQKQEYNFVLGEGQDSLGVFTTFLPPASPTKKYDYNTKSSELEFLHNHPRFFHDSVIVFKLYLPTEGYIFLEQKLRSQGADGSNIVFPYLSYQPEVDEQTVDRYGRVIDDRMVAKDLTYKGKTNENSPLVNKDTGHETDILLPLEDYGDCLLNGINAGTH